MLFTIAPFIIVLFLMWLLSLSFWGKNKPHAKTVRELLITVICSFAPIILACVVQGWFTQVTFWNAFYDSFSKGQVFLYTSAFLSTFFILYVRGGKKPPGSILTLFLISSFGGALLYTFVYASETLKLTSYAADDVIRSFEAIIVGSVIVVWYWSTLPSNKSATSGADESAAQQKELELKFKKTKGIS